MRKLFIAALTALSSLIVTSVALPAMASETKPVPIDHFAIRNSVNTVAVSPDGKHVLVMRLPTKDGQYVIDIYKTDDFSKPMRTIGASPMEFFVTPSPQWVSDTVIVGSAWKWVRKKVMSPEDTGWDTKLFSYNIETDKFKELEDKRSRAEGNGFSIASLLPSRPDEILIQTGNEVGAGLGVDPFQQFRPRSYYYYNVKKGTKKLLYKGNDEYGNIVFDGKGNPRFAIGIRDGELAYFYRLPGQSDWKEYWFRRDGNDYSQMYRILGGPDGYQARVKGKPEHIMVLSSHDGDKAALWEFNIVKNEFVRKLFEAPEADVLGVATHSNVWSTNDDEVPVVAAVYSGAKYERHWFDPVEQALYEQMESKIPNAHQISITSRTRDGQTMIVQNTGPKDPGSFWLVQNGKMGKLASRNVLLTADDLSEVKYIRYPARDGMIIPGYVTMPKGKGPHPLIVLPHGGPHVNEVIGYDEWGQFLANNGYMVLQPQYRMSVGWGKKHFESAMGQHGLAMQDDKDDGAQYLVDKGWADPDRMAMFGWSYGGYAALVAASREPNLYQCVIAGAAVADPKKVYLKRSRGGTGPLKSEVGIEWSKARGGFVGINPIEEVDKVNVPVFMVHGRQDARVLYFNFKDYKKELEAKGKKAKYLTLEEADHFSITLMYDHQKEFYTEMLDFLQKDCGPGGL